MSTPTLAGGRIASYILLYLVMTCASAKTSGADRFWNATVGSWSQGIHWLPIGVPQPADVARIGHIGGSQDWTVSLDQDDTVAGLMVSNDRNFDTNGHTLIVNGDTSVYGAGTLLAIERGVHAVDFDTDVLSVETGAMVRLDFGGILAVGQLLTVDSMSTLAPNGQVRLFGNGPKSFNLEGSLWSGSTTVIDQMGAGRMDLDGASGNGEIIVTSNGQMTFQGTQLHDPFNGTLSVGRDSQLSMNIDHGWELGLGGQLRFSGGVLWDDSGTGQHLQGSHMTVAGEILAADKNTNAHITPAVTLSSTAHVNLNTEARLNFHGSTNMDGGTYTVGYDARLQFHGETSVRDATFYTHSSSITDGTAIFYGPTTWAGNITVNGIVAQNGNATVHNATTVQGQVFDMDGEAGVAAWDITAPLTLQVDSLDPGNERFDGTLSIGGGILGQLNVQLSDASRTWQMGGTLNLAGNLAIPANRVVGTPVRLDGIVNVNGPNVNIPADTTFADENQLNFSSATSELVMGGVTQIEAGSTFQGFGTLINGTAGTMIFEDGADVNVDVHNKGLVTIGDSVGGASVKRFSQSADAEIHFRLAGPTPGVQYSHLEASQIAILDGALVLDSDPMMYDDPQVHGEFDDFVLITANLVDGEFASVAYNEAELTWEFGGGNHYRSHEGDGLFRVLTYATDEVRLVNYRALFGDADGDGVVDVSDFNIWNANKFSEGTDWTTGDFNGDGITDVTDFNLWNANKFTSVGAFRPAAVPEPAAHFLGLIGWALVVARLTTLGRGPARRRRITS